MRRRARGAVRKEKPNTGVAPEQQRSRCRDPAAAFLPTCGAPPTLVLSPQCPPGRNSLFESKFPLFDTRASSPVSSVHVRLVSASYTSVLNFYLLVHHERYVSDGRRRSRNGVLTFQDCICLPASTLTKRGAHWQHDRKVNVAFFSSCGSARTPDRRGGASRCIADASASSTAKKPQLSRVAALMSCAEARSVQSALMRADKRDNFRAAVFLCTTPF